MRIIDKIYIDGAFVEPHGREWAPLFNPATEEQIGTVRLADAQDAERAVTAAKRAFPAFSTTTKAERIDMLKRLHAAVAARASDLVDAMREEYGAPSTFIDFAAPRAGNVFLDMANTLESYDFRRHIGRAEVEMRPSGVAVAITPWNSNYSFICGKLSAAIAAGATMVIKPSEMSAIQTQVVTECLHQAGLSKGVLNIVTGYGNVVGSALTAHRDVSKVTFTGSTATGRAIVHSAAATMKRVTMELGGKSPSIILDDADLDVAIPQVLSAGFLNSGQACIAGTRILVPEPMQGEIEARLKRAAMAFKVGDPADREVRVGPMVSRKQWERVQSYLRLGQEEGAILLTGGEGRPEGLDRGWFVRPTIFAGVRNDMRIAREEIFGPVLSVISYRDEDEAIRIANDTDYGLQAHVFSSDPDRAKRVADQIEAGRVIINGAPHEPLAPFGGFKQSGFGREFGVFGLEAFLEPRAVIR
ncbi:aldehyde dehydrogenase family protein [Neorhizobium sp. Rsf11]|uniref:aldehyde dehydrogenase (NAD(+)) n=2 Tax=Neorhizobium TaxID=1525371 RepID=A0ABV0M3N1_9HYPH|nr:aldehyde dehydrogenase family protein [Neorhizobium petrolearium]MCC2612119.1 aldehyde dehydrogenase family protein [Neorhizobium petrolearium]WGI67273.1 aldehyde dehydrogenase family protein [Neorhizobium petrolearium]